MLISGAPDLCAENYILPLTKAELSAGYISSPDAGTFLLSGNFFLYP